MLPPVQIDRLVRALLADEIARITGRPLTQSEVKGWSADTPVDEAGLGLDSLGRLQSIARVNQFFHLHETGLEDYLLIRPTLGDWVDLVQQSLSKTLVPGPDGAAEGTLTFQTSGSSGVPKQITHKLAHLQAEISALARLFSDRERIVALTPPHHIYGFLFSVLLPDRLAIPVIDGRGWAPGGAARRGKPGDLILATPFQWNMAITAGVAFPAGCSGVTSGAPAEARIWPELGAFGLTRLTEVYGSTETGGIGSRDTATGPLELLAHLERDQHGAIHRLLDGSELVPPDVLEWNGARQFRATRRLDEAVQVGGINVYPDAVKKSLRAHPDVRDCEVRLDPQNQRLKAFIIPSTQAANEDVLARTLASHCHQTLSPPERPARFSFGTKIPRTDLGKTADWS